MKHIDFTVTSRVSELFSMPFYSNVGRKYCIWVTVLSFFGRFRVTVLLSKFLSVGEKKGIQLVKDGF